jgi:ATP-dependent Lon protease
MPANKIDTKMRLRNNKNTKLKKNKDSDNESDGGSDDDYETVSESSDSSYVPPKRKHSNKKNKRVIESDESEDIEESEDEEEEEESDDEEEESDDEEEEEEVEIDKSEMHKLLHKLFPSKYMQEKVNNDKANKANKANKTNKKNKKSSKSHKTDKKKKQHESEDEEESEEDDEDDEESEEEEEEEEETNGENGLYNIIFTMGGEDEEDAEDTYNEDDDKECDSDDEQMFMKETYVKPIDTTLATSSDITVSKTNKNNKKDKKSKHSTTVDSTELTDVESEYLELVETKKNLTEQLSKKPKSKVLKHAIEDCNDTIKKLVKKARTKNAKMYHKLIHNDRKRTNEIDYFKKKLSNKEQLRVMRDLKEINSHINVEKPYRLALLDSKMPARFKATALQKLNVLRSMEPGDPEYYKIKNWVDTFMRVPFGIYKSLNIKMDDGLDVCHNFMENAKNQLDQCVYGLNDAKIQIMQMLGQWIANPASLGSAIAIKGPMGTGKTTLVKEGISKILGREFAFIALGGAGDSSFLEGHSYTYEGSSWGKIVQFLIDSKCMNPIIYFDELDKISDTPRGEEIVGILTHLTDTSQNNQFHDKYFAEVDFDLSKCLFIFSYNDESRVNPILRDRMYRIQTKGYDAKEKLVIARDYLLPKIREQVNFSEADVIIPDETIQYIVSNNGFTKEEAGVRNLKRCLEIIYTKLNLFRLVKPEAKLFGKDFDIEVSFPFTVTKKAVDVFIKNDENQNQSMLAMYM